MNKEFLIQREKEVTAGLKNFQLATVERIDYLFRQGRNRVLVADEVGLGKTLIARGCIAKTGVLRAEEGDDLFKVVYVCSNQNIARKNIVKLDVYNIGVLDRLSDSRLSMQHLRIVEHEIESKKNHLETQLIPLTPQTSFIMTSGAGTVGERALMFQILRRLPRLQPMEKELNRRLIYGASSSWESECDRYETRVKEAEKATAQTERPYPQNIVSEIEQNYSELIERFAQVIEKKEYLTTKLVNELRTMFARISVKRLQPDLVIMDEFQRFKFMLQEEESELGIVAKEFLSQENTRILLLSATPYKLYSTLEEIEDRPDENHYKEFMEIMGFLFKDPAEHARFEKAWNEYSRTLNFLKQNRFDVVLKNKEAAQEELYRGMCRTERLSVMNGEDFIDSSSAGTPLDINEFDIQSYLEGCQFLEGIQGRNSRFPLDYAKSCPFLLSFMSSYKLMDRIKEYFYKHPEQLKGRKGLIWLNTDRINNYQSLKQSNARLELLKKHLFLDKKSQNYLWVPPSLPYYELRGVYKDAYKDGKPFSKILIFSAWEMVPKMIASLISYEAERLTIGDMIQKENRKDKKNAHYFPNKKDRSSRDDNDDNIGFNGKNTREKRYPAPRLVGGSEYYLLYPSKWLASLYNPIESFNQPKTTLKDIIAQIQRKIQEQLNQLKPLIKNEQGQADNRWYLIAPMLLDGKEYVNQWLEFFEKFEGKLRVVEMLKEFKAYGFSETCGFDFSYPNNQNISSNILNISNNPDSHKTPDSPKSLDSPINHNDLNTLNLGRQPEDLAHVLTLMAIGSPVNCIYRSNGQNIKRAVQLTQMFINRFNTPEATAVIAMAYSRKNDDSQWVDLIRYCVDGCFQAMFDEYHHMLEDEVKFNPGVDIEEAIHIKMYGKNSKDDNSGTLQIRGRTYSIDTPESIREKIEGGKVRNNRTLMRSHFAVAFTKGKGTDGANISKENMQDAFNSPLRPFVLASTSIGQEGLDFHYYCRKIMHWNLPGNPIDLEQREGRVNRFKCLAIRQNLAKYYENATFEKDVWKEIFEKAKLDLLKDGESELTPFWCLGEDQRIKIERIVPMYPLSRDQERYSRLIKILSLYRMTMGQARQEELIQYLLDYECDAAQLKSLFMNLSPFKHSTYEDEQDLNNHNQE